MNSPASQAGSVAGCADFQVEDRAMEVEAEVEERAAVLLGSVPAAYGSV